MESEWQGKNGDLLYVISTAFDGRNKCFMSLLSVGVFASNKLKSKRNLKILHYHNYTI